MSTREEMLQLLMTKARTNPSYDQFCNDLHRHCLFGAAKSFTENVMRGGLQTFYDMYKLK